MGHCRESRCRFHLWQGPLWNEQANPGEMEMEHLDTTFSPSSQEHQKSPVTGGETPSPPAEEKDPQNEGKMALCSPYITSRA